MNRKLKLSLYFAACTIQVLAIVFAVFFAYKLDLDPLPTNYIINISLDILGMMISFILYFSCMLEEIRKIKSNIIFMAMLFIETFVLFWDSMIWLTNTNPAFLTLCKTAYFFTYLSSPFVMGLLLHFERSLSGVNSKGWDKSLYIVDGLGMLTIFAIIGNLFFGYFYTIDANCVIHRNNVMIKLYLIYPVVSTIFAFAFIFTHKMKTRIKISLLLYLLIPMETIILQSYFIGLSLQYVGSLIIFLIMYVNIFIEQGRELAINKIKISQQEAELTQAQTTIMVSQMQPHFVFNTLTTIHALCTIDPQLAADTVEHFSTYLRGNIASLDTKEPIPFEKELEHTKIYAEIEMLRFDNIKVEYDLQTTDFLIPALTVQPLVENAIRHGVRIRKQGLVTLRTYKDDENYFVIVEDNGKGFKPGETHGNGNHVGMKNVQERIRSMIGGTMEINSVIDQGTTITIKIPVEKGSLVKEESK